MNELSISPSLVHRPANRAHDLLRLLRGNRRVNLLVVPERQQLRVIVAEPQYRARGPKWPVNCHRAARERAKLVAL